MLLTGMSEVDDWTIIEFTFGSIDAILPRGSNVSVLSFATEVLLVGDVLILGDTS